MAWDGPQTQTEKKQKQPIPTATQDFLRTDFISLPPFLKSLGLKKTSTSWRLSLVRLFPFRVSFLWQKDIKAKLESFKEWRLIFSGMKLKGFGRKEDQDFKYKKKAVCHPQGNTSRFSHYTIQEVEAQVGQKIGYQLRSGQRINLKIKPCQVKIII
jgi:hypothetical protein